MPSSAPPTDPPATPAEALAAALGVPALEGFSLGGIETTVRVPSWRLAVDVGRGRDEAVRCEHLALTHTHMDHAGGLPYVLALRKLFRMRAPRVYAPPQMIDGLREMVAAWDRIQRFASDWEPVPAEPGARLPLGRGLLLEPFRTYHPVPSCGYTVVREVEKLRPALRGLPGPRIAELRQRGEAVTDTVREPLLSVTGDTLPEVLDKQPHVLASRVLVLECTFLDDRKPYEACREGGHVHLRDLMDRADALTCEHLVLSHFSQIYGRDEIPALLAPLAERIPGRLWAFPTEDGEALRGPLGGGAAAEAAPGPDQ